MPFRRIWDAVFIDQSQTEALADKLAVRFAGTNGAVGIGHDRLQPILGDR
jgi:hypothetical protein